jgi:hypothetical protein
MLCLVCETPDNDRPSNGVSEFDALFGHIVKSQAKGFICYEEGGQAWNASRFEELGYDDNALDVFSDHPLGSVGNVADFIELLPYVEGFWTDFWLFPTEPRVISKRVELSTKGGLPAMYPIGASHMFSNVDGSYWALYTEKLDDLESVEQVWHRTHRLEVQYS